MQLQKWRALTAAARWAAALGANALMRRQGVLVSPPMLAHQITGRFLVLEVWAPNVDIHVQTSPLADEQPGVAQRFTKKDVSTSLRNSESGMIDQVMVTTNSEGQRFVKIRVWPLHGQKMQLPARRITCPVLPDNAVVGPTRDTHAEQ